MSNTTESKSVAVGRYDYPSQFSDIDLLTEQIKNALLNGQYVLGKQVHAFEEGFANWLGVDHAIGVNSGTDALFMSFKALGLGPGDEVITQANTFHATVSAIVATGATPVLVDADPDTYLMDIAQVEACLTGKTKAIVPVHLFGKPTKMQELLDIAAQHNLFVVEDAAQAHGAKVGGQAVGTFGDLGAFSFHPSKNLAAAGDAGMIVTNNAAIKQKLLTMRNLGQETPNNHVMPGVNSKLDELQAIVLNNKLPNMDAWNADRRQIAAAYRSLLAGVPVSFQSNEPDEEHVYHLFQIQTPERDQLQAWLRENGVDATVRYPEPIHQQKAFSNYGWDPHEFPVASKLGSELMCLPLRPGMTEAEIHHVTWLIRAFFETQR